MQSVFINGVEYRVFDHLYLVAQSGDVLRNMIPPPLRLDPRGYIAVGRQRVLHRMVAVCWVPNPEGAKHVHHKDKNKQNNHANNLEWVTPKTHISERHAGDMGKHVVSEEAKQKARIRRLGATASEETKTKTSASVKSFFQNPENFQRYRESLKTRRQDPNSIKKAQAANQTPCVIDGVRYASYKDASAALGLKTGTIRRRLFSKNFPTWFTPEPLKRSCKKSTALSS